MKKTIFKKSFVVTLLILTTCYVYCQSIDKGSVKTFADQWEYVGIAVEEYNYTIWGTSPIIDEEDKVHLFVARWPGNTVEPGWRTHSEIAHYIGDSPEGPFVFMDVAVKGDINNDNGDDSGLKASSNHTIHKIKSNKVYAPHNPTIHKIDSLYALFYIVNDGIEEHPSNQYIYAFQFQKV